MNDATLIIGASSKIAQALIKQLSQVAGEQVVCVSRKALSSDEQPSSVTHIQSDYSEDSVNNVVERLNSLALNWRRVVILNGVLHDDQLFPEKQMREVTSEKLMASMIYNAFVPFRWVQALQLLLKKESDCSLAVFSARVGSIEDNRLGGWYTYRASKAALNMLLKTASLELKRTHPNVRIIAFHPGTTDTPLSEPFQQRVPADKLFAPEFVADRLLSILGNEQQDIAFLDWAGERVAW